MVHADQCPVSDHAGNTNRTINGRAGNKIFNCRSIEELDVGEREDLR